MTRELDLNKGGYGGDDIEEEFKWFTSQHMEYWWHFREVLRPVLDKKEAYWKRIDGKPMSDADHKKLIAVGFLNYAVYTGIAEAFSFFHDLRSNVAQRSIFGTRRAWKSTYSSLYSSFNAFCNLVHVIICNKSPFGRDDNNPWNPPTSTILKELQKVNANAAINVIEDCLNQLEIRNQLDHWWTIWIGFVEDPHTHQVKLRLDRNFQKKGYILIEPDKELNLEHGFDLVQRTIDELTSCAQGFNRIYKEIAITGGHFDTYLGKNGWLIEYQDYGPPHNQQRPQP